MSGQTINLKLYSYKNPVHFAKPPADVFNGRFGQQKKGVSLFYFQLVSIVIKQSNGKK